MIKKLYRILRYTIISRHFFGITSGLRVLPDFMVIGVGRSGTTSLFNYLDQHPSVVKSSYDEIEKFLENVESKDVIVPDNSASTTIINNSQSFLLPFKNDGESIFTGGGTPNFNITTNVIDFDYSKMNSSLTDELLFLKLDK